jgi:hypothetical protein
MTMSLIMESYNVVIGSSSALETGTVRRGLKRLNIFRISLGLS